LDNVKAKFGWDALDSGNCDEIRILMTFDCFGIFSFGYVAFTTDTYFEYYGEIFAGVRRRWGRDSHADGDVMSSSEGAYNGQWCKASDV
ncbi:hypothetical protein J1N35_025542, partial [Gossypium stocksii]